MFPTRLLLAAVAASHFLSPALHAENSTKLNAEEVLKELSLIEEKKALAVRAELESRVDSLRKAMDGGYAATMVFERAYLSTQYEGVTNASQRFYEWKRRNTELLRSPQLQKAVQLHIRYLLLSLDYAQREDPDSNLADESYAYANDIAEALSSKEFANISGPAAPLLQQPVAAGMFAKWLSISDWLPKTGDWEPSAGNIDGILEKNVRMPWRKKKDPRLTNTWDLQLAFHAARAQRGNLDILSDQNDTIGAPRYLFGRARERAILGERDSAVMEILQLAKKHPHHPDFTLWAEEVRTMLAPPKKQAEKK
jgi:hypothetical protein